MFRGLSPVAVFLCLFLLAESACGQTLPLGAVARLGDANFWHPRASTIIFAPNDKILASTGFDNTVRFWEVPSGREVHHIITKEATPEGQLYCLAYSPDGKLVATVGKEVCIREAASERILHTLSGLRTPRHLIFSPDGKILTVLAADGLHRFDVRTVKLVSRLDGSINVLAASRDGKTFALGHHSQKLVELVDAATLRVKARLPVPANWGVQCLAFAPGDRILAAGCMSIGVVLLWDTTTGKEIRRLNLTLDETPSLNLTEAPDRLAFSPDGSILAVPVPARGDLLLWRVATGEKLPAPGYLGSISDCAFSSDGTHLAVLGHHEPIRLMRRTADGSYRLPPSFGGTVFDVAWSPDERVLATRDSSVALWDPRLGKQLRRLGKTTVPEWRLSRTALAFSPDGSWLASEDEHSIALWEAASGRCLRRLGKLQGTLIGLSFSCDGKTLSAVEDRTEHEEVDCFLSAWPVRGGPAVAARRIYHSDQWLRVAALFSSDRRSLVLTDSLFETHVCDPTTGTKCRPMVWQDLRDSQLQKPTVFPYALSPDGKMLVCTSSYHANYPGPEIGASPDEPLELWEMATGKRRASFCRNIWRDANCLGLTPDGRLVVVGDDKGLLRLLELPSGRELSRMQGHAGAITSLRFSPSGRWLASGSEDTTAMVWEVDRLFKAKPPQAEPPRPRPAEIEKSWQLLADDDAVAAYGAICQLATVPEEAVSFLATRLHPATEVTEEMLRSLVKDLGTRDFRVRRKAEQTLQEIGERAAPHLRRVLAEKPEFALARRVKELLATLGEPSRSLQVLRAYRAIEVLERIGTAEARGVLERLARGVPDVWITTEAIAAGSRLRLRQGMLQKCPD